MRKLSAIMFTDIVGFSALMSKDESSAMAILERNREMQMEGLREHTVELRPPVCMSWMSQQAPWRLMISF